ncbi:MAG: site-2 protease family protein [Sedimentisphaerales bacterium]|nr:site-2 protease family protein [Sedimentisphaerales bacterium]
MSEKQRQNTKWFNLTILLIVVVLLGYMIVTHLNTFWNIVIVILGFGAVIMVHEFGHFIVAKLSGIKVEAFSIGFPPTLLGIRKLQKGWRIRILPKFLSGEEEEGQPNSIESDSDEMLTSKTVEKLTKSKNSDTEYRIGLVPFGGFVKMLGQEDTGAAERSNDPRSFANKPVWIRIAVVAAGVIFNAISAFLIFLVVFSIGLPLPPAVIGSIVPDSPAAKAGLAPGDRIVEVNGESFVDFSSLGLAPALTAENEAVSLVVKHADGNTESMEIVPRVSPRAAMPVKSFGIESADTLIVTRKVKDPKRIALMENELGLHPGDAVSAVDGNPVKAAWQMDELIANALSDQVVLTVQRNDPQTKQTRAVDVPFDLLWPYERGSFETEANLCHIHSMVPRLKILAVSKPRQGRLARLFSFLVGAKQGQNSEKLQPGDIIVAAGGVANPTYNELRQITQEHKDKDLAMTLLRKDEQDQYKSVDVTVVPRSNPSDRKRVEIGFVPILDIEHPIVAKTIADNDLIPLSIPRGATITTIDGEPVSHYADIVRIYRANRGQRISIEYRLSEMDAGAVSIDVPSDDRFLAAQTGLAKPLPLEPLTDLYKASGPGQAVVWGSKKTYMFIAQTYVTLRRLITRDVSPKTLMGPVGILSASYTIAQRDLIDYIYFLGLISSIIAVMNLLPLPIVDGGVIVLLIIEKIKGSPLNERVQEAIAYAGLVFLLAVFLWLTYQDILRLVFS